MIAKRHLQDINVQNDSLPLSSLNNLFLFNTMMIRNETVIINIIGKLQHW